METYRELKEGEPVGFYAGNMRKQICLPKPPKKWPRWKRILLFWKKDEYTQIMEWLNE